MISKEIIITSQCGLQSKAAAMFIHKSSSFKSSIWIEKDDRKANAKSLLGVLSLSIAEDAKVTLAAEGEDEESAIKELEGYINSGLKEEC